MGLRGPFLLCLALLYSCSALQPPTTRRQWLAGIAASASVALPCTFAANAADEDAKQLAKEAVRVESSKGIAYMREQLEARDYESLMEFTKTYDQILRKGAMGKAKKLMESTETTSMANAVTFDLIGINRNVRKGQENPEQAAKYIQELQDDVTKFLQLE